LVEISGWYPRLAYKFWFENSIVYCLLFVCFHGCFGLFHIVMDNVSLIAFHALFGIADARFSLPDHPAYAWQLPDGCVSGLLGPAWAALNSRSASAKVSSDSFTSTFCASVVTCVVIVALLRILKRTGGSLLVMPLSRR
jgi:hypothetical protein